MIAIRPATADDAAEATRVAHEAKASWGYPARWIELWRKDLTLTPELIARHHVFVGEDSGEMLGVVGLIDRGSTWALEHFWVRPSAMKRGVGRALFDHARAVVEAAGADVLEIDADPNAEGFYVRMGARPVGVVRGEVDGQPRLRPLLHLDVRR